MRVPSVIGATVMAVVLAACSAPAPREFGKEDQNAIEQYFVGRFAQGASGLVMESKDVAGSGAFAYTSGDYRLKLAPAGAPEQRDRGKFLWILKDYSGKWLLEYLIFSSDFPAAPAPAP